MPYYSALKNGSCAIDGCEPCQAGNRAALSSMFDVPQGRLFRVGCTVNAYIFIFDLKVYGLITHLVFNYFVANLGVIFYASGFVQKMASN